jgi:hypothetical protein
VGELFPNCMVVCPVVRITLWVLTIGEINRLLTGSVLVEL